MRKIGLLLILAISLIPFKSYSQEHSFNGMVVDRENRPIDVFSIIVFNNSDSTRQVYANTFSDGKFSFSINSDKNDQFTACILSMGFEDKYVNLDEFNGNIKMRNKLLRVDDVVVKGKKEVKTVISSQGGVVYDVNKTYLSDLGTSTMLLNFIPGLSADNNGNVSILGVMGEIAIYVNNVKLDDNEKLLAIKSEDIKSVEIIRNAGARYKNVDAVVLIKTANRYTGFSSRITGMYYLSSDNDYSWSPRVELAYNKNKINISASYHFNKGTTNSSNDNERTLDNSIISGDWKFLDAIQTSDNNMSHWYSANLDYAINQKNYLNFQFNGNFSPRTMDQSNIQNIISDQGNMFINDLTSQIKNRNNRNAAHLYYQGNFSQTFGMTVNMDYSNRSLSSYVNNNWMENNSALFEFAQNTNTGAMAFTTEVLFNNVIKQRHQLNYGLEYSYLMDDVTSNDMQGNETFYSLHSNFLKTILEFKAFLFNKIALTVGGNYMYSQTNNTIDNGIRYNTVIPYLALQYYNQQKQFGIVFNVKYHNKQPDAGLLDDVTIKYLSPYEISTGKSDLRNEKDLQLALNFMYKKFVFGAQSYIAYNYINKIPHIEIQSNGMPLFVNRPENFNRPMWITAVFGAYSSRIDFWTFNISAILGYGYARTPDFNNNSEKVKGLYGTLNMTNNFSLPKSFSIYLNGSYTTKQPQAFVYQNPSFTVNLNIEKRFMKDQIRLTLETKLSNKYLIYNYNVFGIDSHSKTNGGWYRSIGLVASWRFNNHKSIQAAKENEYLNMLD